MRNRCGWDFITKTLVIALVATCIAFIVGGCSPTGTQGGSSTSASGSSQATAQTSKGSSASATQTESSSSQASASSATSSAGNETLQASDYEIYSIMRNFSDGVSNVWAHPKNAGSNASNEYYFVDTNGKMTKWTHDETNVSNVYKNTVLATLNPGERRMNLSGGSTEVTADSIVNIDGTIIWSIEKDGKKAAEQFGLAENLVEITSPFETYGGSNNYSVGESEEQVYRGYMPVVFTVESFDYAGDYVGIIDHTGKWVVEPVKTGAWWSRYDDTEFYCAFRSFIFNYETGETTYISEEDNEELNDLEKQLEFDGYMKTHDGLIHSREVDSSMPIWPLESDEEGFYDANGHLVISTSKYDFPKVWTCPYFKDGYSMLDILNAQGSEYFVIIDTSGKEMSEPKKLGSHGELSEGAFFDEDDRCFKDVRFEQIGTIDGGDAYDFSDGRAWILDGQSWKCIDSKGTVVF